MAQTSSPKKETVLAIGLDKPTADIVAAAKERGVKVSRTYVDLLKQRSSGAATKKAKKGKAAAPKKAAKDAPKPAAAKGTTKKDFVLSFGGEIAANDIVAAAKKAGVTLSTNYVYLIRGRARTAGPARKRGRPFGSGKGAKKASSLRHSSPAEVRFVEIVMDIGASRARELLDSFVEQARAISLI